MSVVNFRKNVQKRQKLMKMDDIIFLQKRTKNEANNKKKKRAEKKSIARMIYFSPLQPSCSLSRLLEECSSISYNLIKLLPLPYRQRNKRKKTKNRKEKREEIKEIRKVEEKEKERKIKKTRQNETREQEVRADGIRVEKNHIRVQQKVIRQKRVENNNWKRRKQTLWRIFINSTRLHHLFLFSITLSTHIFFSISIHLVFRLISHSKSPPHSLLIYTSFLSSHLV